MVALGAQWTELTAQKLVRYEAVFKLLDDIQLLEDPAAIGSLVAMQWKYSAGVSSYRLVVPCGAGYTVIDGHRGQARLAEVASLSPWDEHHWRLGRPRRLKPAEAPAGPAPPEHLAVPVTAEIEVLPFERAGRRTGLLSAAARREPFSELDQKFVLLLGRHLADRVSDILLRRQALDALRSQARHDALTGLLNRGAIIDTLGSQLALSRRTALPLSVVLLDIDHFKPVNDEHGHDAGDAVLTEMARRLQEATRLGDSLGRYGGEEFLLVLYPCDLDEAARAAERLRAAVQARPFRIGGDPPQELALTVSLGGCSSAQRGDIAMQDLLKLADEALYRSKAEGRNRTTAVAAPDAAPARPAEGPDGR
jgi:diguanylate cyclase (GGDEF)-like protein